DVAHADVARGHGCAVEPDPHRVALAPADPDLRNTIEAGQAVDDVAVGIVRQLQGVHRGRAHVEPDHRVRIAVGLLDLGRVRLVGHAVGDVADRVADIVGGRLDVALQGEFHGHR